MAVENDSVHLDQLETYVSENWGIKVDKPTRNTISSAMKAFAPRAKFSDTATNMESIVVERRKKIRNKDWDSDNEYNRTGPP